MQQMLRTQKLNHMARLHQHQKRKNQKRNNVLNQKWLILKNQIRTRTKSNSTASSQPKHNITSQNINADEDTGFFLWGVLCDLTQGLHKFKKLSSVFIFYFWFNYFYSLKRFNHPSREIPRETINRDKYHISTH